VNKSILKGKGNKYDDDDDEDDDDDDDEVRIFMKRHIQNSCSYFLKLDFDDDDLDDDDDDDDDDEEETPKKPVVKSQAPGKQVSSKKNFNQNNHLNV
jgi:hypothetical protein